MSIKQHIPKPMMTVLLKGYTQYAKCKKSLKIKKCLIDAKLNSSKAVCYCPCCDNRFRSFESGYFTKMPNVYNPKRYKGIKQEVVCPICGTIPRHRILATWFNMHKDKLENKKILYFACEPGIKMWMKRNRISITTADYFAPADLKLDLCNIDQPDNSWDWIICNHVLEHVDDYNQALHELYRILKPGGKLIISFPIISALPTVVEEQDVPDNEIEEERRARRLKNYGQADHLRIFGADSKDVLIQAGFKVSIIDGSKMDKRILPVVGPADYDVNYLFLCEKHQNG